MFNAVNLIKNSFGISLFLLRLNVLMNLFIYLKFPAFYKENSINIIRALNKRALISFVSSFLEKV